MKTKTNVLRNLFDLLAIVALFIIVAFIITYLYPLLTGTAQVTTALANAPDTVFPVLNTFDENEIVVKWNLVPEEFRGVDGVIFLEGANGYIQQITLKAMGDEIVEAYVGHAEIVPSYGMYYLSYGYFQKGDAVYTILMNDKGGPIFIDPRRVFIPALTK